MNPFTRARVIKVFAGAGTGKTYLINQTIADLLGEGVKMREICYVLFNAKPAQAFRKFWEDRGFDKRTDLAWCGTHHSLARKLLGLSIKNIILDVGAWGKDHGFDLHDNPYALGSYDLDGWDEVLASLQTKTFNGDTRLDRRESRLLWSIKKTEDEEGKYFHFRYLEKAIKLNMFPAGVRYLFFDECQDNGRIQWDWVRSVANRDDIEGVMLAGDDKQAINGFKGASAKLFLEFPADETRDLGMTYRCAPAILKEANAIARPIKNRSSLTLGSANQSKGKVLRTATLQDATDDIAKELRKGKTCLVLARNKCFLHQASRILEEAGVLPRSDWVDRLSRTVKGLVDIRKRGALTEDNLAAILPSRKALEGEMKKEAYWSAEMADALRTGEGFEENPDLYELYGELRLGREIKLEGCERFGFFPAFATDLRANKISDHKWNLSPDKLYAYKQALRLFGDIKTVRLDTIHAVKGEEADCVCLLTDITGRVQQAEWDDEDNERRVWYVGVSRAKDTLIITSINPLKNNSTII